VDVWVLAGQSNCVGTNQADGQDMPAAAAPWPGRILCFNSSGELSFYTLTSNSFLSGSKATQRMAVLTDEQRQCSRCPPANIQSAACCSHTLCLLCCFPLLSVDWRHDMCVLLLSVLYGCVCCCGQAAAGRMRCQTCTWVCMDMQMPTAADPTWHLLGR
jgi:hypothetical protein